LPGVYIPTGQEDDIGTSVCLQWPSNLLSAENYTETYKRRAARQNKARRKRQANTTETEDDIGLKGIAVNIIVLFVQQPTYSINAIITASSVKRPRKVQHSQSGGCADSDSDFENKENNGMIIIIVT
jgi:hypothetical protein